MVALGFTKAKSAGYELSVDGSDLAELVIPHRSQLTPGDKGLLLWLLARLRHERRRPTSDRADYG